MSLHSLVRGVPDPRHELRDIRRLNRIIDVDRWQRREIAVVPLDNEAPTTLVTALLAIAAERVQRPRIGSVAQQRVVAVDTGSERELSRLLGAYWGGDLANLGELSAQVAVPTEVDSFVDDRTFSGTPVCAVSAESPAVTPNSLAAAMTHLRHRHGGYILNVPASVAGTLMTTALDRVDRVVGVCAGAVPSWLVTTTNPLQPFVDSGRLVVAQTATDAPASTGFLGLSVPIIQYELAPARSGLSARGVELARSPSVMVTAILQTLNLLLTED